MAGAVDLQRKILCNTFSRGVANRVLQFALEWSCNKGNPKICNTLESTMKVDIRAKWFES